MKTNTQYFSLAYIALPPSILDWFDLVNVDEEITDPSKGKLYVGIIHIYLDERDNRPEHQNHLKANGFTEPTRINDFPIRYPLTAPATPRSLQETFGYIPCDGPFCGAAVDD